MKAGSRLLLSEKDPGWRKFARDWMSAVKPNKRTVPYSKVFLALLLLVVLFNITVIVAFILLATVGTREPECTMTVPEVIRHWGYPVESHEVSTDDGYLLQIFRIPSGRERGPQSGCRPVIFLQHGLEMDASNWVDNPPAQSAGFVFADAGFDVWLGNVRGNKYGRRHKSMNSETDDDFWKFSWSEMSQYDLPAMINYALKTSNASSLHYVGHSQGTLIMFAHLVENPSFGSKLASFQALAPVASVASINGIIRELRSIMIPVLKTLHYHIDPREFLPTAFINRVLSRTLCKNPWTHHLCVTGLSYLAGPQSVHYNSSRTPVYFSHAFSGTSSRNFLHWSQMVISGEAKKFDFGSDEANLASYDVPRPPHYAFSSIPGYIPISVYWGGADWLADVVDVEYRLLPLLQGKNVKRLKKLHDYNHFDFVWGTNSSLDIYEQIIDDVRFADPTCDLVEATTALLSRRVDEIQVVGAVNQSL